MIKSTTAEAATIIFLVLIAAAMILLSVDSACAKRRLQGHRVECCCQTMSGGFCCRIQNVCFSIIPGCQCKIQ